MNLKIASLNNDNKILEKIYCLFIISTALFLRLFELSNRSMHHDESMHAYYSWLLHEGFGLIHNPKVLFLDEPTLGLDIQTRSVIWNYLKKLNKENGLTIFITTHYLEEADLLCDRIAIIDQGEVLIEDTPSNLKQKLGGDIIEISVDNHVKAKELISELDYVEKIDVVEEKLRIKAEKGDEVLPLLLEICKVNSIKVKTVSLSRPSLDEVFLEYTGKSMRDTGTGFSDNSAMQRLWKSR